jgi:hypothetical protein
MVTRAPRLMKAGSPESAESAALRRTLFPLSGMAAA